MRRGKLESLPFNQREELEQALIKIDLIAGLGTSIQRMRDEERRLCDLVRYSTDAFGERGAVAPDGFYFVITATDNVFELSEDEGDWWSENQPKRMTDYGVDTGYAFIAGSVKNFQHVHGIDPPAAAYAYSPDGKMRCLV